MVQQNDIGKHLVGAQAVQSQLSREYVVELPNILMLVNLALSLSLPAFLLDVKGELNIMKQAKSGWRSSLVRGTINGTTILPLSPHVNPFDSRKAIKEWLTRTFWQ